MVAIGNPLGLDHTVTQGIISAKGRNLAGPGLESFIQTDAAINRGNSGGPLLNLRGEVIGINTAIRPDGQNIGFAVPVNMVKRIIADLRSGKPVSRGYLGVGTRDLDNEFQASLGIKEGAVVSNVDRGTPADKAGIQRLDVITGVDGQKIRTADELVAAIAGHRAGDTVTVTVWREGAFKDVKVTLGDRQELQKADDQDNDDDGAAPRAGFRRPEDDEPGEVLRVQRGGPHPRQPPPVRHPQRRQGRGHHLCGGPLRRRGQGAPGGARHHRRGPQGRGRPPGVQPGGEEGGGQEAPPVAGPAPQGQRPDPGHPPPLGTWGPPEAAGNLSRQLFCTAAGLGYLISPLARIENMGKRLLVVDSDRRFIQDHKSSLESAFEVDFRDGTEGSLTRLESGTTARVLLCVETSENKGYALCSAIRRTPVHGDLKIALISAKATEEEDARHRGIKGKADLYLHKPIPRPRWSPPCSLRAHARG